jgi:hypothetical protein
MEVEGGIWTKGRHTRGKGYVNDMLKYNAGLELGWMILRYPPNKIDYLQIKRIIEKGLPDKPLPESPTD